jgi:hypothetical protein
LDMSMPSLRGKERYSGAPLQTNAKRDNGKGYRFRSSPQLAALSDANFGIKGTLATL